MIGMIGALRPVIETIERHDADLARQMRRASSSVALNVAEGAYSRGKNRPVRYQTALGSMRETLACVEVAVAQGYVGRVDEELLDAIDRVMATLFKLVR